MSADIEDRVVKYATWLSQNQDKRDSPEFETVASAYKAMRSQGAMPSQPEPKPERLKNEELSVTGKYTPSGEGYKKVGDIPQAILNFATGASGLMRGGLNLASKPFQFQTLSDLIAPQAKKGLGDVLFPPAPGSEGSIGKTVGEFADPVAWTIGGGVAKVLPYAKVLGSGAVEGAKAIAKNLAGGAAAGGAVGLLSDNEDKVSSTVGGAGIGAVANATLPGAVGIAGKAAGKVWDMLSGKYGAIKAAEILRKAAGGDLAAIKQATAAGAPNLSGVQTTAGIRNDVWNALDIIAKESDPTFHSNKAADLLARQKRDIAGVAGGVDQTTARDTRGASRVLLNKITTPLREQELVAANGAGTLDSNRVVNGINQILNKPDMGTNIPASKALKAVADQIEEWTAKNGGVIDAEALYGIRKNLNQTIESMLPATGDPNAIKAHAARIAGRVKPMIDEAIEKAGGTDWKTYLTTFEKGSRQIDRRRMGADALNMLEKSPKQLESLAAGNEPRAVEKVFGSGNYDFQKEMGAKALPINNVASELTRDRLISESAQRGKAALEALISDQNAKFHLPNWINGTVAIMNRGLKETEIRINKSTADKLVAGLRSGQGVNELLNTMPHAQRLRALEIIAKLGAAPITNVAESP